MHRWLFFCHIPETEEAFGEYLGDNMDDPTYYYRWKEILKKNWMRSLVYEGGKISIDNFDTSRY